ncbi:MAG: FG-GAP-like repeat-containing protein [Candidatus Electronema sp. V4]|uniref:FG-GAP-like repeat-containing protein n=1 Tax=Candidatus Electronema sp. V4 TaxID=3454756 RepID=UPI0040556EB0
MKARSSVRLSVPLFRCLLPLLALLLALPAASRAADTGKIVFLPFIVRTQPPQEHLRNGLTSVLATRLADRTGLTAVHGADKTGGLEAQLQQGRQQEARQLLRQLGGDWLLFGSLEQQAQGYAVRIHVFSGKTAPASFSRSIDALDKTIPAISALAEEIAAKVFHQGAAAEAQPAADKDGMSGFQTAHPDKAWRDGIYAAAPSAPAEAAEGGVFRPLNSLSSGQLAVSLNAMDAGDLDGDGREEIVLLARGRLIICRFNAERFQQLAELPLPGYLAFHALSLADLDGDRRPEICLSASNGDRPASRVVSWDGRQFRTLHEEVPLYLRPETDSAGRAALFGQTAGGKIHRLRFSPGGLSMAEAAAAPQGFGLHDFIRADLDQDGSKEFIGITPDNLLLVAAQDGRPLWKSAEHYGASRDALGTLASRRQAELEQPDEIDRRYIHARLIAQDLTGDGRPEIIVSRNRVKQVDFFRNFRYFEGSSVAVLSWDGSRMNMLWEIGQMPGYTVDYQVVSNAEQPGRFRLVLAEGDDNGNPLMFWTSEKTVIRRQELMMQAGRRQ